MLKFILQCTLVLFVSTQTLGQELTSSHKDSLENVVREYFKLNLEVYQSGSTVKDIDQLFALFTDDFVYVHPKYGGEYSRDDLYSGYVRNQKNGAYNGNTADARIDNMIIGLNAVATERVYLQKDGSGDLKEVDPGMTLFELKNGKISRIFEYW